MRKELMPHFQSISSLRLAETCQFQHGLSIPSIGGLWEYSYSRLLALRFPRRVFIDFLLYVSV